MRKKVILRIIIFAILMLGINITVSNAAISAPSKTVNSGENVSVLISSNVPVTSYKVTMTNNGGLTFVTSSGGTGAGTSTITDAKATGMTSLATYTFQAPQVTKDTTYDVTFSASAMEDESFNAVANSTATAKITVKAPAVSGGSGNTADSGNQENTGNTTGGETTSGGNNQNAEKPAQNNNTSTRSTNANLSDLGVVDYDFKGFKPANTSYNTTVPNDVTYVSIYALTQHSGAKYTVTGNYNLQVGTNKVTITVTAEDGKTKKEYYIYVARQAGEEEEEVVPNVIDDKKDEEKPEEKDNKQETTKEALGLLSIAIEDGHEIYLEPEFKTDIYEYVINIKGDIEKIPFNAIPNKENAKVEIVGNEALKDGENVITIIVKDEKIEETAEYKITVNKNVEAKTEETEKSEEIKEPENLEQIQNLNKNKLPNKVLVIGGMSVVLVIICIILFIILKKDSKEEIKCLPATENDNYEKIDTDEYKKAGKKGKHF